MAKKNLYDEEYGFGSRGSQLSKDYAKLQDEANYWDNLAYQAGTGLREETARKNAENAAQQDAANYWDELAYSYIQQPKTTPETTPVYTGGGSAPAAQTPTTPLLNWSTQQTAQAAPTAQAAIPEFTYENAPEYVSRYQGLIDEYLNGLLNYKEFSYDPNTDPQYAAYRKQYAREGQRAAADVLGQYAAMTGGMPSTAAVTASQQAGDYYAAQMADKIPELYQMAYNMYMDDYNREANKLSMLRGLEGDDYSRYLDQLGQYNTDRSFGYGQYRDAISDNRYADELDYQRQQDEYNRNLALAQLAAGYNDLRGINELGIDTSKYGKVYGGSGGSGSGGTSKSDARSRIEAFGGMGYDVRELPEELLAAAGYSQQELDAMADYYAKQGNKENSYTPEYTGTQAQAQIAKGNYSPEVLLSYEARNGVDYIDTITNYDSAIKMLEGMGITEKPNTRKAWTTHMGQANSNAAGADAWMFDYATYEDYLRDYLREARSIAYGF